MKQFYMLCFAIGVSIQMNGQQFASSVINFSSQFGTVSWSASQATGTVNTYPNYGDITTAWASAASDNSREHISLGYSTPQAVSQILVYETYNCGAVDSIYLRNANTNAWNLVYSTTASTQTPVSRILNVIIPTTSYQVNGVRLALNSGAIPGWNEIDAVRINSAVQVIGIKESTTEALEFGLYPNPNHGTFTIKTHQQHVGGSIEIVDITGKVINKNTLTQSFETFVYKLESGVYFVKVTSENGASSVKKMMVE
jgi:hypothetical protein